MQSASPRLKGLGLAALLRCTTLVTGLVLCLLLFNLYSNNVHWLSAKNELSSLSFNSTKMAFALY